MLIITNHDNANIVVGRLRVYNFLKMDHQRPLFVFIRSFQTIYILKTLDYSGIRTCIVIIEGEHTDYLTTTTDM